MTKQLAWPQGDQALPVRVIADPAVAAANRADGRFVPVAILDTTARPDLAALIRVHTNFASGDVDMQWAWSRDAAKAFLILYFRRPTELAAVIEFDIETQWALIDQILQVRILYIAAGKPGDNFATMSDAPVVTMEIPDLVARDRWEKVAVKALSRRFRKEGISRWEAKRAARDTLAEKRKMGTLRMGRS